MKKPKKLKKLIEENPDFLLDGYVEGIVEDDLNPQEKEDLENDITKELGEDVYHFKDALSEEENGQ